jgi:hypothetical protein
VDPQERLNVGLKFGLQPAVVKLLEKFLLRSNEHMSGLRALHIHHKKADPVALCLEWDEGKNEVAAVVHASSARPAQPRAVVFQLKPSGSATYLNPLSALYEPLSYPLWYPYGGRGWSTDAPVSQMWWYRQQLLRLPYLGI